MHMSNRGFHRQVLYRVCVFTASLLAFAVFTAALSTSVFAKSSCGPSGTGNPLQEQFSCEGSEPASQTNANEPSSAARNPINLMTGNKFQREVDMKALPGELGIEVVRHYNSQATSDTGHVGRGWRLSYETEIRFEGTNLALIQADGKRYQFKCKEQMCRTNDWADGVVLLRRIEGSADKQYTWHWLAGNASRRQLSFDHRGSLNTIRAGSGATLTVHRHADGRMKEVIDPQGRKLVFQYASPLQLQT
jgi:YD repeat-containing protein